MGFWETYGVIGGVFLCLACAIVPRLALFFLSMFTGAVGGTMLGAMAISAVGFFSWLTIPRIVIAFVATVNYGSTNVILCITAWIIAFIGEIGEKKVLHDHW